MSLLKFLLLSVCLGASMVSQALAAKASNDPAVALAALADQYYEAQARFDPVYSATLVGDNRFDAELPIGIAPAERNKRFAMYARVQKRLQTIPRSRLSDEDALTYDMLALDVRNRLGFRRFKDHLLPMQQMDSIPLQLATFAGGQAEQPLKTVAQYEAFLHRIERLPAWTDQAIANMREGMRIGVVQPRPVVTAVIAQLHALGSEDVAANPFGAPIAHMPPSFPDQDRTRLAAAYTRAVTHDIAPAMRRLEAFLATDYLAASRESVGWSALPDGAAWYRQWLRSQTTLELSPDEIGKIGEIEVQRIQLELSKLGPRLGFDGGPARLLAWIRTDKQFLPFRSETEILDRYRAINARVEDSLPKLFAHAPKAALDILPEPELTRATASDHYSLPAEDGSRPGVFWAVIEDPATYQATKMTALFLHEGQPGHHFQMALQQEMPLPQFRKRAWINAYGEGWALYAETLGTEMGLYDDPVAYAGELQLEIFRAARLVVDTGLHAQGWSRQKAVAYLMDTVGLSEAQSMSQVDRYLAWPGQALGYKLGSLKIQELRERAQKRLGPRFDISAFHDAVLSEGALPLSLLDSRIEQWIQKTSR
ncbi:MAG: DUF885 domain-containing protein [Vitreoscilla sp.]